MPEKLKTYHAPAERVDPQLVEKDARKFSNNEMLNKIAEAISTMLLILNPQRQIVYANRLFMEFLNISEIDEVIGKRPGEAMDCINSHLTAGGCGTSEFCRTCGAVNAILESQLGRQSVKECRITTCTNESLDLRVTATPYNENGSDFTIYAIHDISQEKRREILERVFFHDALNTAGGISGLSAILPELREPKEIEEMAQTIHSAANNMVNEIQAQRNLNAAERGELTPDFQETNSLSLLNDVAGLFAQHEIIADKCISIAENSQNIKFITDPVILRRILGNMVKNALEASSPKDTVTMACQETPESIRFSVHNHQWMDRDVQLQLFQRSFSTKGPGRGLGTYSMKLFGEKYLNGKIWFESTREKGTTFFIAIPKSVNE